MNRKMKLLTFVLGICIVLLSITALSGFAAEIVTSGSCGTNVTYTIDSDGVLTISGSGDMADYTAPYRTPWFSQRSDIKTVVIEDGVTSIGNYAFDYCSSLKSITLPDSITSIGDSAFDYCSSLKSITLPDSVTSIGEDAFAGCDSLTSISIPDSVTSIGNSAFSDCSSLASITLPEGVTSIGNHAFYRCDSLTSISIPDSVTSIGYDAFYDCIGLKKVCTNDIAAWCAIEFSDQNANPLRYANGLYLNEEIVTNLVIPEGVTSIGAYAFYNCDSLTSITIPDSITSIGEDAFYWCGSLKCVAYAGNETQKSNISIGSSNDSLTRATWFYNATGIFEQDGIDYVLYDTYAMVFDADTSISGDVVISEEVQGVPVTSIGAEAFEDCDNLISITLPDSITSIGAYAFRYCGSLKYVAYAGNETQKNQIGIGEYNYDLSDAKWLYNTTHITGIFEQDGIDYVLCDTYAYAVAFATDTSISGDVVISEEVLGVPVTSIGAEAFEDCDNLISISIPDSITSIGKYAFRYCYSLNEVYISDLAAWCAIAFESYSENPLCYAEKMYLNGVPVTDLVIPEGVTSIGAYAFYNCDSLTSITIPDSVTSIGSYAFYGCSGPACIILPDSVTELESNAFSGVRAVYVPASVLICGELGASRIYYAGTDTAWAMLNLSNPQNIKNGCCNAVMEGEYVHDGNGTLYGYLGAKTDVVIPSVLGGKRITKIDSYAFCNTMVEKVTVPEGVLSVGDYAFGTRTLKALRLPASLTSIGYDICGGYFSGNYYVPIVLYSSTEAAWQQMNKGSNSYMKVVPVPYKKVTNADGTWYYNDGTILAYEGNAQNLVVPAGFGTQKITQIGKRAFLYNPSLKLLRIPDGIRTVGNDAFENCKALMAVELPANAEVETFAFYGCRSLTAVFCRGESFTKASNSFSSEPVFLYNSQFYVLSYAPGADAEFSAEMPVLKAKGAAIKLADSVPVKTGHAFKGWATVENGEVVYQPGEIYTTDADVTLYAVWEKTAISLEAVRAEAGTQAEIRVSLTGQAKLSSLQFELVYDASALGIVDFENGTLFDAEKISLTQVEDGRVRVTCSSAGDLTAQGILMTLLVDINAEAALQLYEIEIENVSAGGVEFATDNGSVDLRPYTVGDINNDHFINIKDAILLAQYLAEWDVSVIAFAADCNGDGAVNIKDAILLAQYLAEWDVVLRKK